MNYWLDFNTENFKNFLQNYPTNQTTQFMKWNVYRNTKTAPQMASQSLSYRRVQLFFTPWHHPQSSQLHSQAKNKTQKDTS